MDDQPRPVDIYARVSRKGDKDQRSTAGQAAACRAVLGERGLPAGDVHVDDGRSAWNPRVHREGWDALMTRLESGAAGGVIVFDLERFSRQPAEGERLIAAAERGLLVLDSDQQFDLTTASGKKSFRDAMAAAAYYSDRLSDRVKRGKAAKARGGAVDRRSDQRRAFGFEIDNITIRESEAAQIRHAVTDLLRGEPQSAVVARLNAEGVTTTAGGPWTQRGLRDMLLRPRNAGQVVHNGVVVAQLPGAPVLGDGTFERIIALYASRRRGRPADPAYVCSGMAWCEPCGKRLAGRPRYNKRPYPDGAVSREYWCSPSAYGGCGRNCIDQRALDKAARELTIETLSDPRHAAQVEAAAVSRGAEIEDLGQQLAEAEQTALALADRLGRGEITLARYDAVTGPLDRRLASLRAARDALDVPSEPVPAAASREQWAARWDGAEPAERRSLLRMALRGRVLLVARADRSANVTDRITVGERP